MASPEAELKNKRDKRGHSKDGAGYAVYKRVMES